MHISVVKEILDNSITGAKILDGTDLDYLGHLKVNELTLPRSGSTGTARINGAAVLIGNLQRIGALYSEFTDAPLHRLTWFGLTRGAFDLTNGSYGRLYIQDSSQVTQFYFTTDPAVSSYILTSMVFGANAPVFSSTYKYQVVGNVGVDGSILATSSINSYGSISANSNIYGDTVRAGGNPWDYQTMAQLADKIIAIEALSPPTNVALLTEEIVANALQNISSPPATANALAINYVKWGYLAALDQSLATSTTPTFNSVIGTTVGAAFYAPNGDVVAKKIIAGTTGMTSVGAIQITGTGAGLAITLGNIDCYGAGYGIIHARLLQGDAGISSSTGNLTLTAGGVTADGTTGAAKIQCVGADPGGVISGRVVQTDPGGNDIDSNATDIAAITPIKVTGQSFTWTTAANIFPGEIEESDEETIAGLSTAVVGDTVIIRPENRTLSSALKDNIVQFEAYVSDTGKITVQALNVNTYDSGFQVTQASLNDLTFSVTVIRVP